MRARKVHMDQSDEAVYDAIIQLCMPRENLRFLGFAVSGGERSQDRARGRTAILEVSCSAPDPLEWKVRDEWMYDSC